MLIKDVIRVKDLGGPSETAMVTLTPAATVIEAADVLAAQGVGIVVIRAENGSLAGILSERDVVRAIAKSAHAALDGKVEGVMTRNVTTCRYMDYAADVVEKMNRGGFRHVPIVENGEVVGVVSSKDIFRYMAENASSEEQARFWSKNYRL